MSNHNDHQDDYFDDYDPDESECDDGHHEEWIRLADGVYLVCHTVPDGRLLVGWAVRLPNGGYRRPCPADSAAALHGDPEPSTCVTAAGRILFLAGLRIKVVRVRGLASLCVAAIASDGTLSAGGVGLPSSGCAYESSVCRPFADMRPSRRWSPLRLPGGRQH